jgi:cobalt/nickel transport system permease protein
MTLATRDPSIADSPLARWDPRWKLAAVLVGAAGTVALTTPPAAVLATLTALGLALVARVPAAVVLGRVGLLVLAVLPLVLLVPLVHERGGMGWDVGPVRVSQAGLAAAVVVALRVVAIGLLVLVLTRTAPLARTLAAAHALRVPGLLIQITGLAYRYTFLLAGEVRRTRVALRTRGFRTGTDVRTYRTLGHAIGSLLVRGSDRADRVAEAMRCRGFDGTYRSTAAFSSSPQDVFAFLLAVTATIVLVFADRAYFG